MDLPLDKSRFVITQFFGENPSAYARFGLKGHNGIDFGCPEGTPICAVEDGIVEKSGSDPSGYGNYVKLRHAGGLWTLYGHFSSLVVGTSDVVKKGQLLGYSGNTGNSTGAHLHFEVRKAGEEKNGYNGAIDPMGQVTPYAIPAGQARVITNLNARLSPSTAGKVLYTLQPGTMLTLADKPAVVTGSITWVPVLMWVAKEQSGYAFLELGS